MSTNIFSHHKKYVASFFIAAFFITMGSFSVGNAAATMSKDVGTRLINEYSRDCKAYYTEKDEAKDKFNDRCKAVRDDLIAKAGCTLNKSKAATSKQISDCKKTVSKLKSTSSSTPAPDVNMSDLEGIDIKPVEDVGVKSDQSTIDSIVNIVFSLAGGLSLLFTVIGGLRFVLSRGDPQGTAQAKNTIIFALVGLIVTFFAFTIVKFAVNSVF